jgi:rhodanese-related sulfurtransferase
MLPMEIPVQDVKQKLDAGEKLFLIDVREPGEFEVTRIAGSELIPMRTVPASLEKLKVQAAEAPLVVFCHHGMRSLNVVQYLRSQGVANCQSLSGGIDAWSREIDPSVPRY